MNLPDAPIAHEGFFATYLFTVSDLDKSKAFYVRILGGKVIKPDNPCYTKLANSGSFSIPAVARLPISQRSLLETPSDLNTVNSFLNLRATMRLEFVNSELIWQAWSGAQSGTATYTQGPRCK